MGANLARDAQPDVRRLTPAIEAFLDAVRTGHDQAEAEEQMETILDGLQLSFNDVSADPSQLLNEEARDAAADDRTIDIASFILIPLALVFMALCAWQLRAFRRRSEAERELLEGELRVAQRLEAVDSSRPGSRTRSTRRCSSSATASASSGPRSTTSSNSGNEYKAACGDGDAATERIRLAEDAADLEYLQERVPAAFDRAIEGIGRVTAIVSAMKDFGRPLQTERAPADLNAALRPRSRSLRTSTSTRPTSTPSTGSFRSSPATSARSIRSS